MKTNPNAGLDEVRAVYEGARARLYGLFMGEQLHLGGRASSLELADLAGISAGDSGVELCCGSGASMRLLVRSRGVGSMVGVEAASAPVERGRRAAEDDGLSDRITFIVGDASASGLPESSASFVWGEDAWCYVTDKQRLVAEAVRLTEPGGVIAFTDWVEGPAGLTDAQAERLLQMLVFPGLQTADGYRALLEGHGCEVVVAEDTGRFGPSFELYARMLSEQLAFDALELVGGDEDVLAVVIEGLKELAALGHHGAIAQARVVARRPA